MKHNHWGGKRRNALNRNLWNTSLFRCVRQTVSCCACPQLSGIRNKMWKDCKPLIWSRTTPVSWYQSCYTLTGSQAWDLFLKLSYILSCIHWPPLIQMTSNIHKMKASCRRWWDLPVTPWLQLWEQLNYFKVFSNEKETWGRASPPLLPSLCPYTWPHSTVSFPPLHQHDRPS